MSDVVLTRRIITIHRDGERHVFDKGGDVNKLLKIICWPQQLEPVQLSEDQDDGWRSA